MLDGNERFQHFPHSADFSNNLGWIGVFFVGSIIGLLVNLGSIKPGFIWIHQFTLKNSMLHSDSTPVGLIYVFLTSVLSSRSCKRLS